MITLLSLFGTFFYIGLFTIGGGYAMIPLITEEVIRHGWATKLELVDYIAVSESTPGPFSINTATFIGMDQAGVIGAVFAVLGLILPSFIIILLIVKYFIKFMDYKGVKAAFDGLRPAVIGLMTSAAVSIGLTAFNMDFLKAGIETFKNDFSFFKNIDFLSIIIFIIIFLASKRFKLNSYKIILLSAVTGIVFYTLKDLIIKNLFSGGF